jgi:carbonic anhydrase
MGHAHAYDESKNSTPELEAVELVEKMERIGLPNKKTFEELKYLTLQLRNLSGKLKSTDQLSIQNIENQVNKMGEHIKLKQEIPQKVFTALSGLLYILKTSLQITHP